MDSSRCHDSLRLGCGGQNIGELNKCDQCGSLSSSKAAAARVMVDAKPHVDDVVVAEDPSWSDLCTAGEVSSSDMLQAGFPWAKALRNANGYVFGGACLRMLQLRAINATMSGNDVLVVLPTGAGKSRCFQLPALISSGITIIIVPLLALMHDQMQARAYFMPV
eukprot:5961817-Pleurochrysis_carterae.AAC.1